MSEEQRYGPTQEQRESNPLLQYSQRPSELAPARGSVAALKQYATSAWVEAECVCVAAQETGPYEVMMIFKARDMLRDVLHVLNTEPPNKD